MTIALILVETKILNRKAFLNISEQCLKRKQQKFLLRQSIKSVCRRQLTNSLFNYISDEDS